jgi:hypothetical protein
MTCVRVLAVLAVSIAVLAPGTAARTDATKPLLGIHGDPARFKAQTGQESDVRHILVGWNQGYTWGSRFRALFGQLGGIPMIGMKTQMGGREAITPQQIAEGRGDEYLIALNAAIAEFKQPIYIRPFPEMNGHWNVYCAFTRSGRPKPGHSTASFRKAFARVYVIVHGGSAAVVDAKLRRLGMRPVGRDLPENSPELARVIWNPQGYGSPAVPGNSAQAYYPGNPYVDVVGNDLYFIRGKAEWAANDRLYRAHPSKPYAIPEWGLWGLDNPDFVRTMGRFVRSHGRVELISYFNSKPGSIFDLATKPRSRVAYRQAITTLG